MSFENLEFNLLVAGELEIISGKNISDKEKKGRIKLLKKISYFYEFYDTKVMCPIGQAVFNLSNYVCI
jgi:hypothetical protein